MRRERLVPLILLLGVVLFGVGLLGGFLVGGALVTGRAGEEDPTHGVPLEIIIENVPEVPAELLGPSPPIEEGPK